MVNTLSTSFTIVVYFFAFIIFFLVLGMILTRKFNYRLRQFYTIFFGLSIREIILQSCIITNFLIGLYFIYDVNKFYPIGLLMIITVNVLSIFISFDFYTIFADIIYCVISLSLLWLLNVVVNYYDYMHDQTVYYLLIFFSILILIYYIFITIRKIGILIKNHQKNNSAIKRKDV